MTYEEVLAEVERLIDLHWNNPKFAAKEVLDFLDGIGYDNSPRRNLCVGCGAEDNFNETYSGTYCRSCGLEKR